MKKATTTDNDPDTLYARATSTEHAGVYDNAFTLYLSAAQGFLSRSRILTGIEKERCKTSAKACLERAERIKNARGNAMRPPVLDPFSPEEQECILESSSKIENIKYPVWTTDLNGLGIEGNVDRISQPHGSLPLIWERPKDVFSGKTVDLFEASLRPYHIHQNVVTDCSVCSTIAVCLHHHQNFDSKLGLSNTFPQDASGLPTISSNGIYTFKFYLNGTFRRITIDDSLPFTLDKHLISVVAKTTRNKIYLWPSLLEKAYLKVMGGYDFPGSNSSIDIYAITGWIPEHIDIVSSSFVREKVWKRIYDGYKQGACVLTLGTGVQSNVNDDLILELEGVSTRLLNTHSYAILDVYESDGDYWITILNPWDASNVLNLDSLSLLSDSSSEKNYSTSERQVLDDSSDSISLREEDRHKLLNVSWDTVCSTFHGIYLNWNTDQFKHKLEFHGIWSKLTNTSNCVHSYFTLNFSSDKDDKNTASELWILLSRHFVEKGRSDEFIAVHSIQVEDEETRVSGDGKWVETGLKGSYTSSMHVLTRLKVVDRSAKVAIIASYEGPYQYVNYTLRVLSVDKSLSWATQPIQMNFKQVLEGNLTSRNAGGNSTYPSFMINPQYHLHIFHENSSLRSPTVEGRTRSRSLTRSVHVRLVVEGPRDTPWNITLVWRSSEECRGRVYQLRPGDVVTSSGAYSYGVAQASTSIPPGNYCLILSAFEPRHRGEFRLFVESSSRMEIEPIPAEGAGMFCKTVRGKWESGRDGGSPQFGNYTSNPMFDISVQQATSLKFRLQLVNPSPSIAINVTLFETTTGHAQGSLRVAGRSTSNFAISLGNQVTTSGAYVDGTTSLPGVTTPQVVCAPGHYIAVVSTFDPGMRSDFQLLIYAAKADVQITALR